MGNQLSLVAYPQEQPLRKQQMPNQPSLPRGKDLRLVTNDVSPLIALQHRFSLEGGAGKASSGSRKYVTFERR